MVALVGVQSNQYPRALDIARRSAMPPPVAMGGFHVSGCLAMLDGSAVELDACREMGIAMFAGEAEGRLDIVLRDAASGRLQLLYNFMNDLPGIEGAPVPFLPKRYVEHTLGLSASFDAGRGCPYQCSFCTIINVQGRKSRFRSADDVEKLVHLNWAHGIHKFFITDDNFARNKEWEAIFDRLIALKEKDGIQLGLMIQVDTLCHRIENFVEKAKRAGDCVGGTGMPFASPSDIGFNEDSRRSCPGADAATKRDGRIDKCRGRFTAPFPLLALCNQLQILSVANAKVWTEVVWKRDCMIADDGRWFYSKMPALHLQTSVSSHRKVRTIPAALPKEPVLVPPSAAREDCLPVSARSPFPASARSLVRAGLRRRSLERPLAVWPVVWSDR